MKINFLWISLPILFLVNSASQVIAASFQIGNLTISEPWARSSFSMAKSAAAYMTLKNNSEKKEQLISIKSPIAQRAEIHQIKSKESVMTMSLVDKLNIPAKSIILLKPGGQHVMFFGLNKPLEEGSQFPVILEFLRAGKVKIMIKVLKFNTLSDKKRKHLKH
jgi:copper(I)-binding protein